MKNFFIVGVHGVGKTTLINNIKDKRISGIFSISDLIRMAGENIKSNDKNTKDISRNQLLWKEELKSQNFEENDIVILDGHFNLIDSANKIESIPSDTFEGIPITKIVLKIEEPEIIKKRLEKRDNKNWDIGLITAFQNAEKQSVKEFCLLKSIPCFTYYKDSQLDDLKKFLYE